MKVQFCNAEGEGALEFLQSAGNVDYSVVGKAVLTNLLVTWHVNCQSVSSETEIKMLNELQFSLIKGNLPLY